MHGTQFLPQSSPQVPARTRKSIRKYPWRRKKGGDSKTGAGWSSVVQDGLNWHKRSCTFSPFTTPTNTQAHTCTYTRACAHTHHTYIYIWACAHTHTPPTHTHTGACTYTYITGNVHIRTRRRYAWACAHTQHTYTYAWAYAHTHIPGHVNTWAHRRSVLLKIHDPI